ncbi:extracellular solute-binding protein [Anopheles sinensis]|uniref:Extracellular solute-binding protein n=1 Tax=Anopheles sinensis TaxID=74873 RepID=A0A084WLN6_ANOSI|nr:extracellular solute-binding protein [Anopheles sinensis]
MTASGSNRQRWCREFVSFWSCLSKAETPTTQPQSSGFPGVFGTERTDPKT